MNLSHRDEDSSPFEQVIKRFVAAWRQGPRPAIDDYLPAGGGERRPLLIELVHTDLELRAKAGEAVRAEEYLARYPELAADRAAAVELISAEHQFRRRVEPDLARDDYLRRFPQYRAELTAQLDHTVVPPPVRPHEPRTEPLPGVAGYEVLDPLGRGGMGLVYKARQRSLGRLVALKFLPAECAHDPAWLARFRREALTASALNHPNICTIYDCGESAGRPFLSMELVEGRTLETLLGRAVAAEELAGLIGQAANALEAAHGAGVVHRDIKPANLMVRDDGIVKVLDFGLARRFSSLGGTDSVAGKRTAPGVLVGTPLYMSPEQALGEAAGAASDVFSLGLVLYELAAGCHPFRAATDIGTLNAIITETPAPPSRFNPEASGPLEALIQRMLMKSPRLRPTAAEVAAALAALSSPSTSRAASPAPRPARRAVVGRERELAALRAGFEAVAAGRGSVLCVTGEPGIGKTTLVEDFLAELLAGDPTCRIARGRCSERLAGAEAYLPILEVLDRLSRGEAGDSAIRALREVAPAWHAQVTPHAAGSAPPGAPPSQERLKRELLALLEEASRRQPLVIFLDDFHWADASTVDLLAYLGGRCGRLRLLLVLTYRPTEMFLGGHSFAKGRLELQRQGVLREIPLGFLTPGEVACYLDATFPGHRFPGDFAGLIHARTEGNPLFVADLLQYLRDRGVIAERVDGWALAKAIPDFKSELPESVRGLIEMKLALPDEADRRLLSAASVQGYEFDSAVAARVLDRDAAEVEERLAELDRVHGLVRLRHMHEFPDGALTLRYHFVHVLYQNALYAALQPTRKAAWSAAAAGVLLAHHGGQAGAIAGELALLFEAARDWPAAAGAFLQAARHATGVSATREAAGLARRGLAALERLPDSPQRARLELPLQVMLGQQAQAAHGFAAAESERAFLRARELCAGAGESRETFPVMWGLWLYFLTRADSHAACDAADRLLALAERENDPALLVPAHGARTATDCIQRGDFLASRRHAEAGMALYDPRRHKALGFPEGHDPGTFLLPWGALSFLLLGYPDRAANDIREALALARTQAHPYSLALVLSVALIVDIALRDLRTAREHAEELAAVATEQGFPSQLAVATIARGYLRTAHGQEAEGVALFREGIASFQANGVLVVSSQISRNLAEALGKAGRVEEGLSAVAEGLAFAQDKGEHSFEAELHRLRGELLLMRPTAGSTEQDEAAACFRQSLDIAARQQAKWWELRSAMSFFRLYRDQGREAEARPLLAETFAWFTEGADTPDLREAKTLLG